MSGCSWFLSLNCLTNGHAISSERTNCGCLGDSSRPPGLEPSAPNSCQAGHQHQRLWRPFLSLSTWERGEVEDISPGREHTPDSRTHTPCIGPSFKACFTWVPAPGPILTSQPLVHFYVKAPPSPRFGSLGGVGGWLRLWPALTHFGIPSS